MDQSGPGKGELNRKGKKLGMGKKETASIKE
jgi:hypothetical protein